MAASGTGGIMGRNMNLQEEQQSRVVCGHVYFEMPVVHQSEKSGKQLDLGVLESEEV